MSGLFITIEGVEGVGKSSLFEAIAHFIKSQSIPLMTTREPGGTDMAEAIRSILLAPCDEAMMPVTEFLLMSASRSQHVHHIVEPALEKGHCVLCDRFVDASYAYQGGGRGLPESLITTVSNACVKTMPHLTLLLDAPIDVALARMRSRGEQDRIEQEELGFFKAIRETYLQMAQKNPSRFKVIDASQSKEAVISEALEIVQSLLESHYGEG